MPYVSCTSLDQGYKINQSIGCVIVEAVKTNNKKDVVLLEDLDSLLNDAIFEFRRRNPTDNSINWVMRKAVRQDNIMNSFYTSSTHRLQVLKIHEMK